MPLPPPADPPASGVDTIDCAAGCWKVAAGEQRFGASYIVNVAGAWADQIAATAGLSPLGLAPKLRTAAQVPAPAGVAIAIDRIEQVTTLQINKVSHRWAAHLCQG